MVLHKFFTLFDIKIAVTNLASIDMPLQYMCYMNYTYISNATFNQNILDEILRLHELVPSHVNPIAQWLVFNQWIIQEGASLSALNQPEFYDPETVFFTDKLDTYTNQPEFRMISPDGATSVARFHSTELDYMTCWIFYNGEQQIAALALPATCRSEGYLAAQRNSAPTQVVLQQARVLAVTTGIK